MFQSTQYAHHIWIEMRRPAHEPPIQTIPTTYVSCMVRKMRSLVGKHSPLFREGERLAVSPPLAQQVFLHAKQLLEKRGYSVDLGDLVSLFHEQSAQPVTEATLYDAFVDCWGLFPSKAVSMTEYAMRLTEKQWHEMLGGMSVTTFVATYLHHFENSAGCVSTAQLSRRFCFVFIPLTTFRVATPVCCDETHHAIHEADRVLRALEPLAPPMFLSL